jgi:hypothetical protein
MTPPRTLLLLVTVLAVGATACGLADRFSTPAADGRDQPVVGAPQPLPPDQPAFRLIEPEGDLPGPDYLQDGGVLLDVAGNRLVVGFWMGVEDCYGVERVDVTETGGEVKIDIHVAFRHVDMACIEIAEGRAVVVELEQPLGERAVIVGNTDISG